MTDADDDIRERFVGNRFFNKEIGEGFTVVGFQRPLMLLEYDDGTPWDEAIAPGDFTTGSASMARVSEAGMDAEKYIQLEGGGPTLQNACPDGAHDFFPLPSDLGLDDADRFFGETASNYERTTRCRRCGLSASTLSTFLGHETPSVCHRCDSDLVPGETDIVLSPNPEWADAFLCGDCASIIEEEYEPYEVSCIRCGEDLGINEDNQYIHVDSPLGKELGAGEDDGDYVFACDECLQNASENA